MKLESCKVFAQLLEELVYEDSTSLGTIGSHPGGKQVVQFLHRNQHLDHDIEYQTIPRISWTTVKNSNSWILIKGTRGSGAVRIYYGGYSAVLSTGGEVETLQGNGAEIKSFLKGKLGKLNNYYIGSNDEEAQRKSINRTAEKSVASNTNMSPTDIAKKFKPLWTRAIDAAIADMKGHVANMIKNDSFEKAERKISKLRRLRTIKYNLESGGDGSSSPKEIYNSLLYAISMTAYYYYPETSTTDIEFSRLERGVYSPGFKSILADISKGDQQKLGTTLAFFKKGLMLI
jgi:hypothetical protein